MTYTHSNGRQALEDFITIEEAIQLSGYTGQYLRRMSRQGKIRAIKRGPFWLVERASLQAYLDTALQKEDNRFGPQKLRG